jgi:hypothetical protein
VGLVGPRLSIDDGVRRQQDRGPTFVLQTKRGGRMSVEMVRQFLLWCGLINYGLLALWAAIFFLARGWLHRTGRWFHLSDQKIDEIQYVGMTFYKISIFMLFLIPYVALRIVG